MGIYSKLAVIQKSLFVPKGQKNNFGHYNYRSCEDIMKALKPLCDSEQCVCFISNDMEHIGEFNYVKATVTLADLESGESITSTAHAREEETKKGMDGSQISGASSSYARKYALAGLFCIDNEKDSDATNDGSNTQKQQTKQSKDIETADAKAKVLAYITRHKLSKTKIQKICDIYKVNSTADLTAENCEHYISALEKNGGNINE